MGRGTAIAGWGVVLAWGLAPWLADGGALVLVGSALWAWALRRTGWVALAGVGAAVIQLAWFPQAWADAQRGAPWFPYLALCLLQGVPAVVAAGLGRWAIGRLPFPLAVALPWGVVEAVAPVVQVFPINLAVLLADTPLWLFPAAWGGPPLLGALVAGWGAVASTRPGWGLVLLGLWGATVYLPGPAATGPTVRVGLVQPDVAVLDARIPSNAPALAERMERLLRSLAGGVDLIVAPEGAWPYDPGESEGVRRRRFLRAMEGLPPVAIGATVGRRAPRLNSVLAVVEGRVERVDKAVLVPLWERPVGPWGKAHYRRGTGERMLQVGDIRLGVLICYEDLFPAALREAAGADLLLAATNDGWLGAGGRRAHLAAARLAAVTAGKPVLRPTMDGISAVFDARGWTLVSVGRPDRPWPLAAGRTHVVDVTPTAGRPGVSAGAWVGLGCGLALLIGGYRRRASLSAQASASTRLSSRARPVPTRS